jgi:peptidoglycan/LPS O-acetylase OafA/YrhL
MSLWNKTSSIWVTITNGALFLVWWPSTTAENPTWVYVIHLCALAFGVLSEWSRWRTMAAIINPLYYFGFTGYFLFLYAERGAHDSHDATVYILLIILYAIIGLVDVLLYRDARVGIWAPRTKRR